MPFSFVLVRFKQQCLFQANPRRVDSMIGPEKPEEATLLCIINYLEEPFSPISLA